MGKRALSKIFYLFIILLFLACQETDEPDIIPQSPEAHDYFKEIAFRGEFGDNQSEHIKKWTKDLRFVVMGDPDEPLLDELDRVVKEINSLIQTPQLIETDNEQEANFRIFFGSGAEYAEEIEDNASPYIDENYGFTWIYWNSAFEMTRGSMYVDIYRTETLDEKKHLLREELTQSLGLLNDSEQYPESIFYQGWTSTTEFAPIDREVIKLLYREEIQPGMNRQEVDEVLGSFQ